MTSNIGQEILFSHIDQVRRISRKTREMAIDSLSPVYPPEFINRLEDIVVANPPSNGTWLVGLVDDNLKWWRERLAQRQIALDIKDTVTPWLIQHGYDIKYGPRPLNRFIERQILQRLSLLLLNGVIKSGDKVLVSVKNDKLDIRKA